MNGFEAYQKYIALKQHFSLDGYDYFRYKGKVTANHDSFNQRNDRYHFDKIAKSRDNPENVLLSHLSHNPDIWIGEISEKSEIHVNWASRQRAIEYLFTQEIQQFCFPNDLQTNGEHPVLLTNFLHRKVSKETMVILNSIIHYAPYWNKHIQEDIVWPKINFNLKKYSPFLSFDLAKYKVLLDEYVKIQDI